jgi:transcriptional regulator
MSTALASLVSYRDLIKRQTLTLRQRQILDLTVNGKSQEEIAVFLRLSSRQIRTDSLPIIEAIKAAVQEREILRMKGLLRCGVSVQISGHHAHWRQDGIVEKVVKKSTPEIPISDEVVSE